MMCNMVIGALLATFVGSATAFAGSVQPSPDGTGWTVIDIAGADRLGVSAMRAAPVTVPDLLQVATLDAVDVRKILSDRDRFLGVKTRLADRDLATPGFTASGLDTGAWDGAAWNRPVLDDPAATDADAPALLAAALTPADVRKLMALRDKYLLK